MFRAVLTNAWARATRAVALALGAAPALLLASPLGVDATLPHTAPKEAHKADVPEASGSPPKLHGTLVQTHTQVHAALSDAEPTEAGFEALLFDRATGEHRAFDPRLLGLLRQLCAQHAPCRVELVSGFRSPKLNEMMRKKGRHVASHSQHSLGHAVDFRIVPPGSTKGIDPRLLEKEIRALSWDGGVGVYPLATDWFVHADVGRNRRW
jgi:uncharacterized protein YcbK (DUF882 family)